MITITRLLECFSGKGMNMRFASLVFLLFSVCNVNAQPITVHGTVTSQNDGTPLPVANVMVKGTINGTATSLDGEYSINASQNDILIFSYIGFQSKEVTVGNQTLINVALSSEATGLNDVVVIGYGTQKRSDLTGSVGIVDVDDAKKNVTYDVAKMLQGQVAGVTVQSSGEPGSFVNIKIRGITSFSNNNPLFVVDGMLIDSPYDFAPGEVESIQVLKDASAAAIYGVRGANGVIIITTKKGKNGKIAITFKSLTGFQTVPKKLSLTDRKGYQKITNAARLNSTPSVPILPANDPTSEYYIDDVDTDWQDAAFRTGIIENHSLTFSGGAESLNYSFNLDYFKNTSYIDTPQDYERTSVTVNLNGTKGKFKYGSKMAYTNSGKENFNSYLAGTSSLINLLQAIPTMPVYDPDRLGGYGGTDALTQKAITLNVIGYNNLIQNQSNRNRFIGNVWGEIEVLKGLKYTLRGSFDRLDADNRLYIPESDLGWYYITTANEATLDVNNSYQTRTILDNLLNYDADFGKHKLGILGGWIQETNNFYNHYSRGTGYPTGTIPHLEYATVDTSTGEYENTVTAISYLSRINYSYDDRYFLTFNFRQDKSSLFPQANNSGNYYSVSGAWKIHNDFKLPSWWNTAKLRGGYGILGNNTVGVYAYASTVNPFANYNFNNETAPGTIVVDIKDPNIKWEDTKTVNAAVELGMFDDQLQLTAEYYIKTSSDLLASVPLPYSTGAFPANIVTNAARVRNKGMEFLVSYNNQDRLFKYSISANAGTLKNEVLQIGTDNLPITGTNSKTEVGRSIGEIYVLETEGLFQSQADIDAHAIQPNAQPGDVKFKDTNEDGIITDADKTYQGVTIPKISYGLNLSCSYKSWDLSAFLQGSAGNMVYNGTYNSLMIGGLTNSHTDMLNYWTPQNTNTNVPRPDESQANGNARASDRFVEKGDYIKLQNVQIGYSVPLHDNKFIQKVRLYATGQNLLTISGYRGYDPDFISDGLFSRGFDYGSFPNPRTIIFGLEVSF